MTTSIVLLAAVTGCSLVWAVAATILAYNRGREVDEMAERHNSVADELKITMIELDIERQTAKAIQQHIDRLKNDKERFQALYIEGQNKLNAVGVIRDPKTGRFVNPNKAEVERLCDEVKANAVTDIAPKNSSNG